MNNNEMRLFLGDVVLVLNQKYEQSYTKEAQEDALQEAFREGAKLAYYDCLDVIHQQLVAFGYTQDFITEISPLLGKIPYK